MISSPKPLKNSKQFCVGFFQLSVFVLLNIFPIQYSLCQDWKFIPNKDNLFHNHPTGFLEDSLGFMWMGTNRGLVCFDGSEFLSPFSSISDFSNNGVISLLDTAKSGKLRFRSNTDQFVLKKSSREQVYYLEKDTIPFFKIDGLGRKWRLQQPANDLYFSDHEKNWTPIKVDSLWLSLDIDKSGTVWLAKTKAKKNKIYRIANDTIVYNITPLETKKFPSLVRYFTFISTPDEDIYYYSGATDELFKLNPTADTFEKIVSETDFIRRYFNIIKIKLSQHLGQKDIPLKITAHYFDSKHHFWVGTEYGIFIFSKEKLFSFNRILRRSSIRSILKSFGGDIWLGSYDGLYKVGANQDPTLISPEFFYSFYQEDSTYIFACTEGGGLRRLDKTTQKVEAVLPAANEKFLRVLHQDRNEEVWVGSYGFLEKGIYTNDGKLLTYDPIVKESLKDVYALAGQKNGGLWAGCKNGLFLVNQNKEVIKNIYLPSYYSSETVLCLKPSITGNDLWVGTKFAGLFLIENNSGKILKHYGIQNILPDNTIASIINVKDSLLFLGTNKGLCKLDIPSETVTTYIESNSSLSNEYNHGASFMDKDGNLYFGTINGMIYFHPDSLEDPKLEQKIYFTTFEKINPKTNEMSLVSSILDSKKVLEIFPGENIFTISFSSNNTFTNKQANVYYQMENLNQNWVKTTTNQVTYNNLEPGNYRFKVKLEHLDEKDQIIKVPVKIYPQFYQTIWFKSLLVLGAFFAITYIYKLKIHQLKREQSIRENLSRDIHDDLGGSLTYLHIQAQKLQDADTTTTQSIAQKLLQHTKLSLESLTNLLWVLDANNDTLEDTVTFLKGFVQHFFHQEGADFSLDIQINQPFKKMKPEKRQHLFLILKEACTNILKHTNPSTIHFYCFDHDNALNFGLMNEYRRKRTTKSGGNGLNNMAARIKHLKGTMEIKDSIKNFSISVKIPL